MALFWGETGFTYDRAIGEFVLTHPDIQIPKRGKIYSMNEANRWNWDKPLQEYVTALQTGQGETKTQYSSRYIGSMVGDVHRTLLYGGIFGLPSPYPTPFPIVSRPWSIISALKLLRFCVGASVGERGVVQERSAAQATLEVDLEIMSRTPWCAGYPADTKNVNGKLRLLYEAAPMSFLIEQVVPSLCIS